MQSLNFVVTEKNEMCGAIVMWSLDGGVKFQDIEAAWAASGLEIDDCPSRPSPGATLRATMSSFAKRNRIVRPIGEGQLGLVEELVVDKSADLTAGEEPLEHRTLAVAKMLATEDIEVTSRDPRLAQDIVDAYNSARDFLGVTEFSMWLTTMVQSRMNGVPLRPRGGVYFVPRDQVGMLDKLAQVIEQVSSHKLYRISALKTNEAVEAILDAVVREASEVVADVTEEADSGKLTKRSGKSRKALLEATKGRLETYEALLDARREEMHAKLEAAEAHLAVMIMAE